MANAAVYALADGKTKAVCVGSSIEPWNRLGDHLKGLTQRCVLEWLENISPRLPQFKILDWYSAIDRIPAEEAWIGDYVRRGWHLVNATFHVWPVDREIVREATSKYKTRWWHSMTAEQRSELARRREAQKSVQTKHLSAVRGAARRPYKQMVKQAALMRSHLTMEQIKLAASKGASTRNHNQYHFGRGLVSPSCKLCQGETI